MPPTPDASTHPSPTPFGRIAWALIGSAALVLALIGVVLPVIPGLPFAVLAGLCFANVSVRVHDRMLRLPAMRPVMGRWQRARHRSFGVQVATACGLAVLALIEALRLAATTLGTLRRGR